MNGLTVRRLGFAILLSLVSLQLLQAQPGSLNKTFDPSSAINWEVNVAARQPDGKILIGSALMSDTNFQRSVVIIRVNALGVKDPSFNLGVAATNLPSLTVMMVQTNGQIIVGGFGNGGIARLNPDGSKDAGFKGKLDEPGYLTCMDQQPDGKLLIGAGFTTLEGTGRSLVARLNADGTLDSSFKLSSTPVLPEPTAIAVLKDGKVLVGGGEIFGTNDLVLARLNPNGSFDRTFYEGLPLMDGARPIINVIRVLEDGRILVAGYYVGPFESYSPFVLRLLADGTRDPSFTIFNATYSAVNSLVVEPSGKIVVAGQGSDYLEGTPPTRWGLLTRLNADGTVDKSFNAGNPIGLGLTASTNAPGIRSMTYAPPGNVLIAGRFNYVGDTLRNGVALIQAGEVTTLVNPLRKTNSFSFSFLSEPLKNYQFQYRTSLSTSNWNPLGSLTGDGSLKTLTDSNAVDAQRFYRVITP